MNRLCFVALLWVSACDYVPSSPSQTPAQRPPAGGGGGGGGGGGFCAACVDGGGAGGGTGTCGSGFESAPPVTAGTEPPALIGGTMVALREGGLVIGDADRDLVWLISSDLATARQVPLAAGDEPGRVVEGADGRAYVVLRRADQLAEVDVTAGTARRIATCHLPRGLAVRGGQLVVACLGGELETVDPATGARSPVLVNTPLSDLRDVVVDGTRLIVTQLRAGAVSAIAVDGTVTSLTSTPVASFRPRVAWRAVPRPSGGVMVVRQLHRTSQLPSTASCDAYGGGGLGMAGGAGGGTGVGGSVVQAEAVTISGDTALALPLSEGFPPIVLPVDVAVSASGRVAVLSAGTGSLALLSLGTRVNVPLVEHDLDTQLTSVVFSGESALVFVREPSRVLEINPDGVTVRALDLPGVSRASTGHELFHRATTAGLACASCHPEAGEDGHVWPFFEGARRTPTLRGDLGGTAPFHWSGDLPTMSRLMQDVMVVRMSGPTLTDARIQAVERWINSQPALAPPSVDVAAAARGQSIFESPASACTSCHSGVQGTNNTTVNVGTGAAFQVPRLAELAWRAPWFHDGRMTTLQARFDASSGGEAHGHLAQLTTAQRADLLEYLRSR